MPAVRRPRLVSPLALAALAVAVSACASSGSAGWTYAPQPSITAAPSPTAAPSASATPSTAPSAAPGDSAAPSGSTGTILGEVVLNIAFANPALQAPAGQAFVIDFDNQDAGIPHNMEIKDAAGATVFKGEIVTGPVKAAYQVPGLTAGSYPFVCTVHPNMTGTLTVQ